MKATAPQSSPDSRSRRFAQANSRLAATGPETRASVDKRLASLFGKVVRTARFGKQFLCSGYGQLQHKRINVKPQYSSGSRFPQHVAAAESRVFASNDPDFPRH